MKLTQLMKELAIFMNSHPSYSGDRVDGIINRYVKYGQISAKQWALLEEIHTKWKVPAYINKMDAKK
jgi:hypothetical protein